jgi:radical SAM-linked protein
MRIRVNFERPEEICYIGHIDLTRALARGMRRSELPLRFTEGFNQRVKMEMGFPLSVGMIGEDEYFDFYLSEEIPEEIIAEKLKRAFRNILIIKRVKSISYSVPALTSMNAILTHFVYGAVVSNSTESEIERSISDIMKEKEIIIKRKKGNTIKNKDVRPFIKEAKVLNMDKDKSIILLISLYFTQKGSVKIDEIKSLMENRGIFIDFQYTVRKRTMVIYKGRILSPMDF